MRNPEWFFLLRQFSFHVAILLAFLSAAPNAFAQKNSSLKGFLLGVQVAGVSDLSAGVVGKYWSDYFGFLANVDAEKVRLESEVDGVKQKMLDDLGFSVGAGFMAGFPIGPAKPYLGVVASYKRADDETGKLAALLLAMPVGIDVLVAKNVAIGLRLLSFDYILSGRLVPKESSEDTETTIKLKGQGFGVGTGISLYYRFPVGRR